MTLSHHRFCMTLCGRGRIHNSKRRGAIGTLMVFVLPVLFVIASLAIHISYAQLVRAENMVATDAAAHAGGRALSEFHDIDVAMLSAKATGSLNTVAGVPWTISIDDGDGEVELGLGIVTPPSTRFSFLKLDHDQIRKGQQPAQAMRVNSRIRSLPLLFPSFGEVDFFEVQHRAVATQIDRDIILVLDRSGSMDDVKKEFRNWDWQGNDPWAADAATAGVAAGLITFEDGSYRPIDRAIRFDHYYAWVYQEYYRLGDAPISWNKLKAAVEEFLIVLDRTYSKELVGLVTYAGTSSLDAPLQADYADILERLNDKSPDGSTNIGGGIEVTATPLSHGRKHAAKTLVVFTDGRHNSGIPPEDAATMLVQQLDATIHTITFGERADQDRMKLVADVGRGEHYHAQDEAQLTEVFRKIANNMRTILTH